MIAGVSRIDHILDRVSFYLIFCFFYNRSKFVTNYIFIYNDNWFSY